MNNPAHPGKVLTYYMQGRSVTDVAKHIGVTRPALSRVVNGRAAVSAEMALRLSEAFDTDPDFWLLLQAQYDLGLAAKRKRARIKPLSERAAA